MSRTRLVRPLARLPLAALVLGLGACSTLQDTRDFFFGPSTENAGSMQRLSGFIGGVAADEPNAAVVGREVLATGGNAADAAVAMGFALAATYPSRASLGGGGGCLAYNPSKDGPGQGNPEAILFVPPAATPPSGTIADRPAAVPMVARGLFMLSARYGSRPIEQMIAPAEQGARFGFPISRALARDLAAVGPALLSDADARGIFAPNGKLLAEGDKLVQPALSATLADLRVNGVGELYQGVLARRLVAASAQAGGPITEADLRAALPKVMATLVLTDRGTAPLVSDRSDHVAFLQPPADGGLAAAAAFRALQQNPADFAGAAARAAAVLAEFRAKGGDPAALLATPIPQAAPLQALPASTSFVAFDKNGGAVACAETDNNLFGTGRVAPGTGIVLAASPAAVPPPMLAAALTWNANIGRFRAAVAGSGQNAAGLGVAVAMLNALRSNTAMPAPVPDPGRVNVASCPQYLPGGAGSCSFATDPRGAGVALGGD